MQQTELKSDTMSFRLYLWAAGLLMYVNILTAGTFHYLNVENGLSSRSVFQIRQDSTGFIWFFTHAGVDRYDGSEIKHYKLDENLQTENNLLSSTSMICDQDKNIWILLKSGKIYCYNKINDDFTLRINLNRFFPDIRIALNAATFDKNNRLWLCLSSGLYLYDLTADKLTLISDCSGEQVTTITIQDNHSLFAGSYKHVYALKKVSGDKYSITRLPLELKTRAESMLCHKNKLYVGTFSSSAYIIDLQTNSNIHLNDIIPDVPIRAIVPTADSSILIGTDGSGLYCINETSGRLLHRYVSDDDNDEAPRGNTICDIFADKDNRIWIGTSTNGVSILDPELPKIRFTQHEHGNTNSLAVNHVNTIFEDSEGNLWYGTNNGISAFFSKNRQWKHFLNEKDKANPVILTLTEDVQGNIWAGGFGTGAYRINKHTGQIQAMEIRKTDDALSGLPTAYIYTIFPDHHYIWLGGIEGQLTRYNIYTQEYKYYDIECIGDIREKNDSTLILAACNGLILLDKNSGKATLFNKFNSTPLDCPVRCLFYSPTGDIWMATSGKGILRFNPDKGDSDFYLSNDKPAFNSALAIVGDDLHRIWFSTECGLYYIDPQSKTVVNMGEFFGIGEKNYNANACMKKKDGNLIFGTANGTVEFSPKLLEDAEDTDKLIFTGFKLFYKSLKTNETGSPLKMSINETSSITLKYNQNCFSILFSSIGFNQSHKVKYRCKLEGFDTDWHETGKNADYTNIPPGRYEFKLKAINKYTDSVIDERNIILIVQKPLWASGWALAAYMILAAAIVFFIIQYIRARIEKRYSKEKINFFVNAAHDIRTPVTLIKAPLSELENEMLTGYGKKTLATAIQNTDKLYSLVTQLLDFQKADQSSEKMIVSKNELYSYMNEKVASFKTSAIQKNIHLAIQSDFNYLEVYFDRNKMNKIIDNLLSNAIKYTTEGGSVSVILSVNQEIWSVEVRDSGIGIPSKEQKNLFKQFYRAENAINSKEGGSGIGLLLTRKLVKQHAGEISFTSAENQGSSFKVSFPAGTSQQGNPSNQGKNRKENIPANSMEKILLVEDNNDMRAYLKESLSQEYSIFDFADGRLALEEISGINPDIVVADVLMPFLKGDEMCRILKSSMETSHIPVILLTALSDKENIIKGLESGADDYITKPFDSSVLKARIRNILHNREKLRKAVSSGSVPADDYLNELDKEFMNKAVSLIEKEMSNPDFSINEFCMSLGMSRTSTYNKIKTLTGQAPNDFIRIIRLNKAHELLKSQRFNVSEVADMVGFSDAKYFSTSFKKQFGTSPSKLTDKT